MNPRKGAERRLDWNSNFCTLQRKSDLRDCSQEALGSQGAACSPGWGEDVESGKLRNPAGGAFPRQIYRSGRLPGCDECTFQFGDTEFNPVRPREGAGSSIRTHGRVGPSGDEAGEGST